MEKLILEGRGGSEISASDLLTDEMIGMVEGLNPNLGKPTDAYYNESLNFKQEINGLKIITIDADHVTSGRFDNLDIDLLNGEDPFFKELKDSDFVTDPIINEEFLLEFTPLLQTFGFDNIEKAAEIFLTTADPYMEEEDGYILTKGYATPYGIEYYDDTKSKAKKK